MNSHHLAAGFSASGPSCFLLCSFPALVHSEANRRCHSISLLNVPMFSCKRQRASILKTMKTALSHLPKNHQIPFESILIGPSYDLMSTEDLHFPDHPINSLSCTLALSCSVISSYFLRWGSRSSTYSSSLFAVVVVLKGQGLLGFFPRFVFCWWYPHDIVEFVCLSSVLYVKRYRELKFMQT